LSSPAAAGGHLPGPKGPAPTVFFLSDYGLADEFVGVVHAVVRRLAPGATVLDLTHGVPAFDVRAGSEALVRAVPHLGHGVVLGVVDPGVGGPRRGVAIEAGPASADAKGRWFVGPDNGLLVAAAELCGGIRRAFDLVRAAGLPDTFDGRDVFAPAAAALATGGDPARLGSPFPPGDLVRIAAPVVERRADGDRQVLRAEATWIDHFGNVQLAAVGTAVPLGAVVRVVVPGSGSSFSARRVRSFAELAPGELGVLSDANGRAALAVREGSAGAATGASTGTVVELTW
jgi:S-adenosyl-L-methionine hydrolase (adenosine-forming)